MDYLSKKSHMQVSIETLELATKDLVAFLDQAKKNYKQLVVHLQLSIQRIAEEHQSN